MKDTELAAALKEFQEQLGVYWENLRSDDSSEDDDDLQEDKELEPLTKEHPLDIAATKVSQLLGRKNLPNERPHRAGHAYRKLIAASGGMSKNLMRKLHLSESFIGDFDVMEHSLRSIWRWVESRLDLETRGFPKGPER